MTLRPELTYAASIFLSPYLAQRLAETGTYDLAVMHQLSGKGKLTHPQHGNFEATSGYRTILSTNDHVQLSKSIEDYYYRQGLYNDVDYAMVLKNSRTSNEVLRQSHPYSILLYLPLGIPFNLAEIKSYLPEGVNVSMSSLYNNGASVKFTCYYTIPQPYREDRDAFRKKLNHPYKPGAGFDYITVDQLRRYDRDLIERIKADGHTLDWSFHYKSVPEHERQHGEIVSSVYSSRLHGFDIPEDSSIVFPRVSVEVVDCLRISECKPYYNLLGVDSERDGSEQSFYKRVARQTNRYAFKGTLFNDDFVLRRAGSSLATRLDFHSSKLLVQILRCTLDNKEDVQF